MDYLQNLLHEQQLDAILISSVANIIYLTNFSYFSPVEREAYLLITSNNNYIITDLRYSHAVKEQVKDFQLIEKTSERGLETILTQIVKAEKLERLGIEGDNLTVLELQKISKHFQQTKHVSLAAFRSIKTAKEVATIQEACRIGDEAFTYILTQIKAGISEKELAFALEWFIRKQDAEISFSPIVAFAQHAAVPHHKPNNTKLQENEAILFDFGVKYENYCSDMTHTVWLGKATKEAKQVYETVLRSQQKAITELDSSLHGNDKDLHGNDKDIVASQIDAVARQYLISQGYDSMPHSLGHGIGLEVHEFPTLSPASKTILQPGMVFSIEPGIYLPDKFGVRIEDLFVIQSDNTLMQLTHAPKELVEI